MEEKERGVPAKRNWPEQEVEEWGSGEQGDNTLIVTILTPSDNESFTVRVSADVTPQQIVDALVREEAISRPPGGASYQLAIKGGALLNDTRGITKGGVTHGTTLRLLCSTPGASMEAMRLARLEGDLREMRNIRCSMINWRTNRFRPPTVYTVTFNLPCYLDSGFTRAAAHRVRLTLEAGYPLYAPPDVRMVSRPVFHPNVFEDGRICCGGSWNPTEGLAFLTLRIARMLLYDPAVTSTDSPANVAAAEWYEANRLGLDQSPDRCFPDPITGVVSRTGIVRVQGGSRCEP